MISPIPLRLIERRPIAPDVLHLGFEHAEGKPLPYKPGQFVQIYFRDAGGADLRRSFSVCNAPPADGEPKRWDMAVSILPDGVAGRHFSQMRVGDTVSGMGPFGRFHLMPQDAPRRYLLVATGTGIAPYRAMLPELQKRIEETGAQVHVYCGARTEAELLYRDDFLEMAQRVPGFVYRGCVSREPVTNDRADLCAGRVQAQLMAAKPDAGDLAMICGNPAMVDECAELLRDAGLPLRSIRRERYVSAS